MDARMSVAGNDRSQTGWLLQCNKDEACLAVVGGRRPEKNWSSDWAVDQKEQVGATTIVCILEADKAISLRTDENYRHVCPACRSAVGIASLAHVFRFHGISSGIELDVDERLEPNSKELTVYDLWRALPSLRGRASHLRFFLEGVERPGEIDRLIKRLSGLVTLLGGRH